MRHEQTDVLIVGAGPVGMFLGLLLAKHGIKLKIIDQAPEVADQSYACALHGRSVKVLNEAGLGAELIEFGRPIDAVVFRESMAEPVKLKFSDVTPWVPNLLTMPQSQLEGALERKLRDAGVTIAWHHRLADLRHDSVGTLATIEELTGTATGYDVPRWETVVKHTSDCSAQFVIGADGCHSVVRRLLGLASEPFAKPELFVVYEFESDTNVGEMNLVLRPRDRNVFWPLSNGRCRWAFEWTDTAPDGEFPTKHRGGIWFEDQAIAARTRLHLEQLLQTRAPWFEGSIGEITWASDVQFEPHLVTEFGRGRCWLVGDAAHQTGPIGVQSMNVGIREAQSLATAIVSLLHGRNPAGLLDAYSRHGREEWLRLLGANVCVESADASARIRHFERLLSCIPASGKELEAILHALGLELAERYERPPEKSACMNSQIV